jgi:predicted ArsR family transcriptional regulator
MSTARVRVFDALLRCDGPITVASLAMALGVHPNTVREHLDALVLLELATRSTMVPAGRGRPACTYNAVQGASPPDARIRDYADLANALAGQIVASSADPEAEAIAAGEPWGRRLAGSLPVRGTAAARRSVVALLDDLGFEPAADRRSTTIRLSRCPLLEVARARPDVVCSVHLGLVRGVLDTLGGNPAGARLLPFSEPGACRLVMSPTTPARMTLPDQEGRPL